MNKSMILGLVWTALVIMAAVYTYRNFKPGILK